MEYSRFVGRTLGQYTLEAPLGKGSTASVYRAYQASMDRYVAIKVMTPEIADDPNFVERFQREARIIGKLEHPHILPVIDFGASDGIYYIVMRYMEGGSLDDRLRQRRLRIDEIAHYLDQIASALDYAHQRGVIHRDLKPSNVLLDRADNCYLTDFGIARVEGAERRLTVTGSVMGTPAYMSPEQAMGKPLDGRSDIYSLGVMLYEMVTGRLPFTADTAAALIFQHVYELPPSARQFAPELPEAIDALFNRALAKTPEARHSTARELADHFARVFGIRSAPAKTQQPAGDETVVGEAIARPTVPLPSAAAREAPTPREQKVAVGSPTANGTAAAIEKPRRGVPIALLGIGAVVLLALGGSAFFLIGQNETPSATPSFTPSVTFTQTPNATETLIAARLATADALETAQALQTQRALEAAQTATALSATQTVQAALDATATFVQERLQTAEAVALGLTAAANATSTAEANAALTQTARTLLPTATPTRTSTPTRTATRTPPFDPLATLTAAAGFFTATPRLTPIAELPGAIRELTFADLSQGIQVLRARGVIPPDATLIAVPAVTEPPLMHGNVDKENIFYLEPFSRARFYDFLLSVDVSLSAPEDAIDKTSCGVFMAATNEEYGRQNLLDADMAIFRYLRTRNYRLTTRVNATWASTALASGSNPAIRAGNGERNRLTLVMVEGTLSVYINGVLVAQASDPIFERGGIIGYFMIRGAKGFGHSCSFQSVQLWRLN